MPERSWIDRVRPVQRLGNRCEAFELKVFGRSLMTLFRPGDYLVIETIGRRSGTRHSVPVAYLRDDDGHIVIGGGAAGMIRVADWVLNLRQEPRASIVVQRKRMNVIATELDEPVRQVAHSRALRVWKGIDEYETKSGRPIPYFQLAEIP